MNYPQFLKLLNEQQNRTVYVRITSLTLDEIPQESILGNASQGSVNIDGNSAVRRTCSLTLTTDKIDFNDYYWTINSKFKVEIGLKNNVNTEFEDIIWFNQGLYYISTFNCSLTTNNYTINISGKDKMCGLNGEIGGTLTSSVDFGTIQETDAYGNTTIKKLPIKTIITEMLHTYANEPYHNIILNDLDELGLELQEYKYDVPLYLWRKAGNSADGEYTGATLDGNMQWYAEGSNTPIALSKIPDDDFESLVDELVEDANNTATKFYRTKEKEGESRTPYYLTKIQYGNTVGYKESELVYAGDLIANPGETLTSILDKIKTMLGEFEYFYNVEGQFIFQKKKTYVNTAWTPVVETDNGSYVDMTQEPIAYSFDDLDFFTSFANTPNIANLRNDFTVWGTKKSSTGKELACHMRYAVQNKPIAYTSISVSDEELTDYNKKYGFSLKGQQPQTFISRDVDWEIKKHYNAEYNGVTSTLYIYNTDFNWEIRDNNTAKLEGEYSDNNDTAILALENVAWNILECDWRELIYRMALDYRKYNHLDDFEIRVAKANPELFATGRTGFEQYYIDMEGFWRQLYNWEPYVKAYVRSEKDFREGLYKKENNGYVPANTYDKSVEYYKLDENFYPEGHNLYPWSRIPYERPEDLIFWIDFLEVGEPLAKFSVDALGPRPKVDNNKDVKAIQYRETPKVIFYDGISTQQNTGYRYLNAGRVHYKSMFSPSTQGLSAKTAIDNLLYNNLVTIESVTINSIPIYSLQPNTLIRIDDDTTNIHGNYIVSKLTVPLAYNGTMSIIATKFIDKFL